MTQPPFDDDFQDRIQRILNEKKKDELRENYGMQMENADGLSPQAEGEWLDYIAEFERQFENARRISVRERIGNPAIKSLTEIPESELETELDQLLELLAENNIAIDFIHEIDDRDAYRFITEELLDETTDDIRIPGMISHFIYEEFHPNDEDDITQAIDEFLYALFKDQLREKDSMAYYTLSKENMRDSRGELITLEQFKQSVTDFYEKYPVLMNHSIDVTNINIDGDNADAEVQMLWHAIPKNESAVVKHEGISKFRLERSVYGGWDITQVNMVGWDFS
ncbi:MAG TPA: hypothetical protein PLR65_03250 [Anaerolineales bacterium]|nr:hypothetical protein [Anaerolineales bacterium]